MNEPSTYILTPEHEQAMLSVMVATFTYANVVGAGTRAGIPYERAYRVADRILQRERKAGRIKHVGGGKWVNVDSHDEFHRRCLAADPDFDRRTFDEQTRIRDRVLVDEARFTCG